MRFVDLPARIRAKAVIGPLFPKHGHCWLWQGSLSGSGYGRLKLLGTRINEQVHRFVYELAKGIKLPKRKVLDHLCRNRACFNPRHVEPVTHKVNILRGTAPSAINAAKIVCDSGHSLDDAYKGRFGRKCRICQKANTLRYYWEGGGREKRMARLHGT